MMYDKLMDEIFEQFETASAELENENFELSMAEIIEIENDIRVFNDLVNRGLIELY